MALTQISTDGIKDTTIATADIADDAVTADKLANSINTEIAANTAKVTNATHTGEVTGSGALTIANDAVVTARIADDAVTADKLANSINTEIAANTAKVTNATHTGEVTGATALTIADDVVDEANLKVSNSPTNGQFLSAQSGNTGGLTWAAVPNQDSNLPCFLATNNTQTNLTANQWSRLDFSTEEVDSASAFAETAKFTPQTAGYYYVWGQYTCRFQSAAHWMYIAIHKNGSVAFRDTSINGRNSDYDNWANVSIAGIVSLNGSSDYIELYANNVPDSGTTTIPIANRHFGAFRLGPN